MSVVKVEIIEGGQTATEYVPEIALPKLVILKSDLKSLKNNHKGAYFLVMLHKSYILQLY